MLPHALNSVRLINCEPSRFLDEIDARNTWSLTSQLSQNRHPEAVHFLMMNAKHGAGKRDTFSKPKAASAPPG